MKKITCLLSLVPCLLLCACDLNPKITALPDTVGEFISARFPTMLADPGAQPEIYNSAANDYGTYAATDVYGSNAVDEYTLYASGDDYIMPTQGAPIYGTQVSVPTTAPGVDVPDVLVVGSPSDYLTVGDRVTPPVAHSGATPPASGVGQVIVAKGDTLYSLSRKYSVPVNDLAVMNKLEAPFALRVGQKLSVPGKVITKSIQETSSPKSQIPSPQPKVVTSNPATPLPKIAARTSSKFSWPVRGTILSAYGAKRNGLFNDGINIGAKQGTNVLAAENGVVAYAGNELKGMGNLVIVQHTDGWMTVYAHMDSMSVRRGARVSVGGKIGTVGQTGKVDAPQLHFEIRKGTKAYNPVEYLKK